MSATDWTIVLLWVGAVAAGGFVLLYGLTREWWISWIGRALFVSSTGLTVILGFSVYVHYHPFVLSPVQANYILCVPVLGALLKLLALLLDLRHFGWRRRKTQ